MKTHHILPTLAFVLFVLTAAAQQGINYKAIVKDGDGNAIANTVVTVQFTILESGTTTVYQETHNPTTDANGIVIVNIGEGTVVSEVFGDIGWGANPHFLKTEINIGDGLTDMGTTEFKTVPYALHALNSEGGVSELNDLSDVKIFGESLFIGQYAGESWDAANTDFENTAYGNYVLYRSVDGSQNTAMGYSALKDNTYGSRNTALGALALNENTAGSSNTAIGKEALVHNTTGTANIAIGANALIQNTDGNGNIAIGNSALFLNQNGNQNIAIGDGGKCTKP